MSIDGRSFAAGQAFLLSCKTYWTRVIYPAVRDQHEAGGKLETSALYQYYCWLERHLQRFKYSGRYGLQPYHAQQRQRLEEELRDAEVELAAKPEYPDYYTRIDIHQHPGGVWSDPIAGFVYERGARSTTPLAGGRHRDLHDRLTSIALEVAPKPARVLDMGCGFGKSTRPFSRRATPRPPARSACASGRWTARAPTMPTPASISSPRPCCCTRCRPKWWSAPWRRRIGCCGPAPRWCTSTSCRRTTRSIA